VDLHSDIEKENEASQQDDHEDNFFELPQTILPKVKKTRSGGEPYIAYSKLIWMTQDDYLNSLEQIASRKEEAAQEEERRRLEGEANRAKKAHEKNENEKARKEKQILVKSRRLHNEAWSAKVVSARGDHSLKKYVPTCANALFNGGLFTLKNGF